MLRPYNIVRILGRHHATLPAPRRAPLIQDHVDDKSMQPGAERALAPKRAQLVPQPHEDILCALLGISGLTGEAETERVDTAGVLAIKVSERRLVASLRTDDEIVRERGRRGRHRTETPSGAAAFGARSWQGGPREGAHPLPRPPLPPGQARAPPGGPCPRL